MKRSLLGLIVLALLSCSTPQTILWNTDKPSVKAPADIAAEERRMFALVNADRKKAGLAALRYDEALADVARAHSYDMQQSDFFAHESPNTGVLEDRMDRAGYLATEMRENLATAPTVAQAEKNLLKSPGHRANLLADSVSHIGIGIVRGDPAGDQRVLMITQVFAMPATPMSPAQAPAAVLRVLNTARSRAGLAGLAPHPFLAELAERYVDDLPDDVPSGAVGDISSEVAEDLGDAEGHGLDSVQLLAQAVFGADDFTVPDSIRNARANSIGVAARKARDERGRPRIKVLALVGRN